MAKPLRQPELTLHTDFPSDLREWACHPMHNISLAHKTMMWQLQLRSRQPPLSPHPSPPVSIVPSITTARPCTNHPQRRVVEVGAGVLGVRQMPPHLRTLPQPPRLLRPLLPQLACHKSSRMRHCRQVVKIKVITCLITHGSL